MTWINFFHKNNKKILTIYLLIWHVLAPPLIYVYLHKNVSEINNFHPNSYVSRYVLFEVITAVKYDLKPNILYKSNDPNFNGFYVGNEIVKSNLGLISILESFSFILLKDNQFFKPPPRSPPYFS